VKKRPPGQADTIFSTFESIWPELYRYITQALFPKMVMLECMYVRQALDILEGLFPSEDENKELAALHTQMLIVFAVMWSLGALLELDDRKKVGSRSHRPSKVSTSQAS
jgi:dynein heavy chain